MQHQTLSVAEAAIRHAAEVKRRLYGRPVVVNLIRNAPPAPPVKTKAQKQAEAKEEVERRIRQVVEERRRQRLAEMRAATERGIEVIAQDEAIREDAALAKTLSMPALSDIAQIVCDHYRTTLAEMRAPRRIRKDMAPRQVAMWLMRRHCLDRSMPTIGKFLKRDHTTVLHGCCKIDQEIERDSEIGRTALELNATIVAILASINDDNSEK